jgi:succinyl-diaminopimelate desuccinylase
MDILGEPGVLLLRDLVRFDTINNPGEGKYPDQKIITYLQEILQEWIPNLQSRVFTKGKYSSLYLANDLNSSCNILFMGHLDVVPISKGWKTDPFKLTIMDNKYGYGRGSKDCKGSVVSSILFLRSFFERTNKDQVLNKVGLFLSTDEETGGEYGAKYFFNCTNENKLNPKSVINVDGGPRVVFKRRAGFKLSLHTPSSIKMKYAERKRITFDSRIMADNNRHSAYFVRGVDTHALLALSKHLHINPHLLVHSITGDWVKNNVIPDSVQVELLDPNVGEKHKSGEEISYDENLTRIISLLRSIILLSVPTELTSEFGVTVNPNVLSYSSKEGTDLCFDVRAFLSPERKELLVEALNHRLGSFAEKCQVHCSGSSGFFHTNVLNPLVTESTLVMKSYSLMGQNEQPIEQEGASDARYASAHKIPVIDLGPKGGNIHGSNEYIDLESMIHFSKVYYDIVSRLVINS